MPRLPFCLLISITIAPFIHAYTMDQGARGKINGSLSGPHDGDWLIETRCDCFTSTNPRIGFIYQWEYYNYHSNATFLLAWVDDKGPLENHLHGGWVCREYALDKGPIHRWHFKRKYDKLCFWPQMEQDRHWDWQDFIRWNWQTRALGVFGNQGIRNEDQRKVNGEICPGICGEWMVGEHDVQQSSGKGTQKFWDYMDDMCDDCK